MDIDQSHSTLRFLGAAQTVTGSKFLTESGGERVLIDCGLFQGSKQLRQRNWSEFAVPPASISALLLSHAHLDHTGYLPLLVRNGYSGPIYATENTAKLAAIVLADSGRLQEEDAEYANRKGYSKHSPAIPLYTENDALEAVKRISTVPFDQEITVANGFLATFRRAGHILGSSSITLTIAGLQKRLLFSGDLGRSDHPLLLPPAPASQCDVMVIESTYGDRVHETETASLEILANAVNQTTARGGVVVVPSFAVDRTEVVLFHLNRLAAAGRIAKLPVYVDSPMSLAVLSVYRSAITERDPELRLQDLQHDPFGSALPLHEVRTVSESRALNDITSGIILASSGMATGGRILHHLEQRLPDARNTVLLVGYQAPETRGHALASGAKVLKMHGKYISVAAEISQINGLSAHADADELVAWVKGATPAPEATYVVHGEQGSADRFASLLREINHVAVVPHQDERIRLI